MCGSISGFSICSSDLLVYPDTKTCLFDAYKFIEKLEGR